jgi:hypothetical protein
METDKKRKYRVNKQHYFFVSFLATETGGLFRGDSHSLSVPI